jgi:APA family basic amino acid/polyamine antiporter
LVALKRELSLFDLTNIVVGAVVGSDIYMASALTASLVGPFSLVLWVVAGVMAVVLALIFAYSAYYVPKVGDPSPTSQKLSTTSTASWPAGACG